MVIAFLKLAVAIASLSYCMAPFPLSICNCGKDYSLDTLLLRARPCCWAWWLESKEQSSEGVQLHHSSHSSPQPNPTKLLYGIQHFKIADLALKSLEKWQRSALLVSTLAPPTPVSEFSSMERFVFYVYTKFWNDISMLFVCKSYFRLCSREFCPNRWKSSPTSFRAPIPTSLRWKCRTASSASKRVCRVRWSKAIFSIFDCLNNMLTPREDFCGINYYL